MGSYYGDSLINDIKERCNIVDVIGSVVQLKKTGNNYKGLCPFHNEKTPSFVVSPSKQIFTCFGCGETGNVISFVMKYYNLEFVPAVEKLAEYCNIDISKYRTRNNQNKEEYYRINREAAVFFYRALRKKGCPGYLYLTGRGLDNDTLRTFGLGYADEKWDSLYNYMKSLGYDEKKLLNLGLISESKGKYFDKFRNRVIFPIINTNGKIIGFGGRVITDGGPKYLNSPETPVFSKKNNLYALNLTRKEIEKKSQAILVEGYMDVISLFSKGITNVTASLGTALTENQADILKRYSGNGEIVISYDSDAAGKSAALRALDIISKTGCHAKVLNISHGKDPDEYIREFGKSSFLELVEASLPLADYKIRLLAEKHDMNDIEGRVRFMHDVVPVLRQLNPIEADLYIKKLSKEMKISEGAIRAEYDGGTSVIEHKVQNNDKDNNDKRKKAISNISPLEKDIIKLMLLDEKYAEGFSVYNNLIIRDKTEPIILAIQEQYEKNNTLDLRALSDSLDDESRKLLNEINSNIRMAGREEEIFDDCIKAIKNNLLKEKEKLLIARLSMADEEENSDEISEIMNQLIKIQNLINE